MNQLKVDLPDSFKSIGVISDIHGKIHTAKLLLDKMMTQHIDMLWVLGDLEYEQAVDLLLYPAKHSADEILPVVMVQGNCDGTHLMNYASSLGIQIADCTVLHHAEQRYGLTHGHDPLCIHVLVDARCDKLFMGHTHIAGTRDVFGTTCFNPGAFTRIEQPSVGHFCLQTQQFNWIHLD